MTTLDDTDLLPAERKLLAAVTSGEPCNLIGPRETPTHDEIAAWSDPDREVRADVLAQLVTNRFREVRPKKVDLNGAIIRGDFVSGPVDLIDFRTTYSRYQTLNVAGATFTEDAVFTGVTFTNDAVFTGATFTKEAWFGRATFTESPTFDRVRFNGGAGFVGATFAEDAFFDEVTFIKDAKFDRVTFTKGVWLAGATFTKDAWFTGATFTKDGVFTGATFTNDAWFDKATFTGYAAFGKATFTGNAKFGEAMLVGMTIYDEAIFGRIDLWKTVIGEGSFRRATFNGPVDGAWAARTIDFDEARFVEPVTIQLLCPKVNLTDIELRSRGNLQVRGGIDGTAATFGGRTTLADPGTEAWDEWLPRALKRRIGQMAKPSASAKEEGPGEERISLAEQLLPLLDPDFRSTVSSLRRATVTDLELAAVDLTDCRFEGAHGLDKMRMNSVCVLPDTPDGFRFSWPLRFTGREVIAEEREWRKRFASWEPEDGPVSGESARNDANGSSSDTTTIAGIYRGLRKGREDSSDLPGAADFYYGEMEMRRLARREWRASGGVGPRKPSLAEHCLLTAYWAVSGYGLRAWRAIAAIAVVILLAASVFATVGVDRSPEVVEKVSWVHPISGAVGYEELSVDQPAFTWWDGLELASRSSVLFLRSASSTTSLTGIGTVVDITLRLLVPVLLGLAALAIRGRTKR